MSAIARQFVNAGQPDQPTPVGVRTAPPADAWVWPSGEVANVKRGAHGSVDLVLMHGVEVPLDRAINSYGLRHSSAADYGPRAGGGV